MVIGATAAVVTAVAGWYTMYTSKMNEKSKDLLGGESKKRIYF